MQSNGSEGLEIRRTVLHLSSRIIRLTAFQVGVPFYYHTHRIENLDGTLLYDFSNVLFSSKFCSIPLMDNGVYQMVAHFLVWYIDSKCQLIYKQMLRCKFQPKTSLAL